MRAPSRSSGLKPTGYLWTRTSWVLIGILVVGLCSRGLAQQPPRPDAVQQGQTPSSTPPSRPEQTKSPHDQSDVFTPKRATPSSPVVTQQPKEGKNSGFDFFR